MNNDTVILSEPVSKVASQSPNLPLGDGSPTIPKIKIAPVPPSPLNKEPNKIVNYLRYGLILLILGFLAFNLFKHFRKEGGGGFLSGFDGLFSNILNTFSQTLDISSEGVTKVTDDVEDVVDNAVENIDNKLKSKKKENNLNKRNKKFNVDKVKPQIPIEDDAGSLTQGRRSKSGFCYIGEDRGFRSCIRVNDSDKCMSGDIFPSKAICINPNLRE